jgi:hypothetical protein
MLTVLNLKALTITDTELNPALKQQPVSESIPKKGNNTLAAIGNTGSVIKPMRKK